MRLIPTMSALVIVVGMGGGCSSGESVGSDPSSESSSPESAPEPAPEPAPTVEPATGPLLTQRAASLRLPEGWVDEEFPGNIQRVGGNPEDSSTIYLSQIRTLDSEDKTLDVLARINAGSGYDRPAKVEAETTLQGVPIYHVSGQISGEDTEAFGTIVDRDVVTLEFTFDKGVRDELQEEIIAEVFAGFEWKQ